MFNKKTPFQHRNYYIICTLLSALTLACQGPETVERKNIYTVTDGDSYTLDVFMLSEWAGRIIPEKYILRVNVDEDDNYNVNDITFKNTQSFKFDGNDLYFYPYAESENSKFEKELKYLCSKQTVSENDTDHKGLYICEIWLSGTESIANTWQKMESENASAKIYLGSGDNFGVSLPAASSFNDYPTIQMMRKLGMTADTFGNHSFDYSVTELRELARYAMGKDVDKDDEYENSGLNTFPFITTNFSNLPNNLEYTTPYTIVDIPSDKGSKEPLHLAIVSAFDDTATEIISRGKFGTMTISDYCPVINAMEEAFNKNARGFIILSHVFTDKDSIRKFFNGLFQLNSDFKSTLTSYNEEFNEKFKNQNTDITNDSKSAEYRFYQTIQPYPCTSHLIVTQKMLDDYNAQHSENLSVSQLREVLHQKMLNSILMVMGEASYDPFMVPLISNADGTDDIQSYIDTVPKCNDKSQNAYTSYYLGGCSFNADSNTDNNILDLFTTHSWTNKDNVNGSFENNQTLTDLNFNNLSISNIDLNTNLHPIWLMENKSKGHETARATFTFTKESSEFGSDSSVAPFYNVSLQSYEIEPVFSNKIFNDKIDECKDVMQNNGVPDECRAYFNEYESYIKEFAIKKANNKDTSKLEAPEIDACQNTFLQNDTFSIDQLEKTWACLYDVSQFDYDIELDKFINKQICKLGPYWVENENKDNEIRKYSTFFTNFVTDLFFRSDKIQNLFNGDFKEISAVYMNAGSTREISDFNMIDSEFLNSSLPYKNTLVSLRLTIPQLVEALEIAISGDVGGAFPAIAGLRFSYETVNKENQIRELWKYDWKNNSLTLLYLSESHYHQIETNPKLCILEADSVQNKSCTFGDFSGKVNKNYFTDINLSLNSLKSNSHTTVAGKIQSSYLNTNIDFEHLNILVNSYMLKGGDRFPFKDTNLKENTDYASSNTTLLDGFGMSIDKISETDNTCQLPSDTSITVEKLLSHNLIKRIFNVSSDFVGEYGYDYDYQTNPCVATQKELYNLMMQDNKIELKCNYPE